MKIARRHLLSVDVEDWAQSTLDRSLPVTSRVVRNTKSLLDLLDEAGARATFFVLGIVAERFPALVREISCRGHEIASHGRGHIAIGDLTPSELDEDIRRAVGATEAAAGVRVNGYRAPDFSLTGRTRWAYDVLQARGIAYDSSVVPAWNPRYGIRDAPIRPHRVGAVWEIPLGTFGLGPLRLPLGGGYLRVAPETLIRHELDSTEDRVLYVHPYELDRDGLDAVGRPISLRMRLTQNVGRSSMDRKLRALLARYEWDALERVIP